MKTKVADLFVKASEMAPEKREDYLAEACGEDAELRLEVQRMLVDAEKADSYFGKTDQATLAADGSGQTSGKKATPSSSPTPSPQQPVTEKEGDVIGPFKLLQPIGEGGFGTVWMAEQSEPITRRVALKVIKAGMDTREVLARFEAERQALAMMDHLNIARVLDAGATPTGRPWFAMELVKGIPITEFSDQQKFDTKERLDLFRDVCSAINHAHQKGVIHRDIKPSNVMVTLHGDKPVVKVIDFGIAKATQSKLTDKTLFTRFEQFIGTPVYMSPEQAALSGLDIDTRSDIYALGVLLYELLSGRPPFDPKTLVSAGYEEMRRIIREEEPPRPSVRLCTVVGEETAHIASTHGAEPNKLIRQMRGDLDWIVMKAIDKDRTRRYETANAFSLDIGRFLEDEPVQAAAPTAAYKFKKFARRNKAAFGVVGAIATVLVLGTVISAWQAVRATKAESLASERLIDSERARNEAEAISTFLIEVFQSPDPARDGRTITVAETLDTAAKTLETKLADQPKLRAKLQATVGKTYHILGLSRSGIPLEEMARDYYLATWGPEHPETLKVMTNLATSYDSVGRREDALKMREDVLAMRSKVLGPEHPRTLWAMGNLAISYHKTGREEEALTMREEVLTLRRKILGPENPSTLWAMNNLANSYYKAGRNDEALNLRKEVLTIRRKVQGLEHPGTLLATHNLANSYYEAGRNDEALMLREEVLEPYRKVRGQDHPETLWAMHNLANSYYEAGRRDEALKLREEVLRLRRKMLGPEHPSILPAMQNLANSYNDVGRNDEAATLLSELEALKAK